MNPHDQIVSAILDALPAGGELRLLGRVSNAIVGNSSRRTAFLFIPDLHLISPHRRRSFGKYGFSHEDDELLANILESLARLRSGWDESGVNKLVTIQVGDFFDLWREFGGRARPEQIEDETHGRLRDLLYRGVFRDEPCLRATMLLGNHDTKRGVPLSEIPFQLKAFNRSRRGRPFLFATHGDAFDLFEQFAPDVIQEFIVHFIGRLTPTNKYTIESWGKLAGPKNKTFTDLKHSITQPEHVLDDSEGAVRVLPEERLPAFLAQQTTDPTEITHGRFDDLYESLEGAAALHDEAGSIRLACIGHTHHAAMIACRPETGRSLVMMDVGSWIEECTYPLEEGDVVTEPCAQLGVVHGNDVRLYQVRLTQ